MIGPNQKQSAAKDSIAIQSGGDTNINNGLSPIQMQEIIECIANQLPRYAAIATSVVEERLKTFEEKIIERFDKDEKSNNSAFEDPDFQHLLLEAQKAFSRSGDEKNADILIDLIAERSKESGRTRRALNINKAVEVASLLTDNEISELSVIFFVRMVKFGNIFNEPSLGVLLNSVIVPFVDRISRDNASYAYMESLGCGKLSLSTITFSSAMNQTYKHAVSVNSTLAEAADLIDSELLNAAVGAGIVQVKPNGRIFHTIPEAVPFRVALENCGLPTHQADSLFNLTSPKAAETSDLIQELVRFCPRIENIIEIWDNTDLCKFELSGVGTTIGYSNLKRETIFDGEIDIWVR